MQQKKNCGVCKEEEHKYRCPRCDIRYCSLKCYKEHKESDCDLNKENSQQVNNSHLEDGLTLEDRFQIPELELDEEETEDKVSKAQLDLLDESPELKAMLNNPHLRHMMIALVKTNNPTVELDAAMQEPIFTEFADKCLSIIHNQTDDADDDFPEIEDL